MKKIYIFLALVVFTCSCFESHAKNSTKTSEKAKNEIQSKGEKLFLKNVDECLTIIEQAAIEMPIQGAVVIAFIPGNSLKSWISKMRIVGKYTNDNYNFLAIASAKVAEMATVLSDGKDSDRKLKKGEWGYQGKVFMKVKGGYLLGAFSGGSAEQDKEVAKEGLDWLAKKYIKIEDIVLTH